MYIDIIPALCFNTIVESRKWGGDYSYATLFFNLGIFI
jgi:hypothetical protein